MKTEQIELTFHGAQAAPLPCRRSRAGRAKWWFAQMRRVVDCAVAWQPVPTPRPEQTQLKLAH
jgi:hypothetical protein